jgi:phage baseplate assembly protein W
MASSPLLKDVVYSDVSITFTPHPVNGRLPTLFNAEAVKRALKNLLLTNFGEKLYAPEYGGNIRALLFENVYDTAFNTKLRKRIEVAIRSYEPRVQVHDISINLNNDGNSCFIGITFSVVNERDQQSLTLSIERVR